MRCSSDGARSHPETRGQENHREIASQALSRVEGQAKPVEATFTTQDGKEVKLSEFRGKKPVVLIQNTGIFESGDSIRGLGLDVSQPLVMLIGYRGWDRHGVTRDSAARFIEHILHAGGINYYLVEADEDVARITLAIEEAQRTAKPVAVLVGTEFGA